MRTRIVSDTYDTAYFDPAGMDDEVRTPLAGLLYLKLAAVAVASGWCGDNRHSFLQDDRGPHVAAVHLRMKRGVDRDVRFPRCGPIRAT
jgi:hypothetical protein